MPSQFAAQTMPLGQLFASLHTIQTPPYQRSFAWEQDDASKLLEDLTATLDAGAESGEIDEYFLGTMLFIEVERQAKRRTTLPFSRQPRVLEVVDGLQRLTTLTILFCVIRDLDEIHGKPSERLPIAIGAGQGANARHRLMLREPDETFFHAHVRAPGATRAKARDAELSPVQTKILEVRDHLLQCVQELDAAQRQRLADFLLDKCHVVVVSTTGIDRAHRMFTVLNDSGKPLDRHDILKADLLGGVPPAAMERATATWDQAKARLGKQFDSLFSHIRIIHGRSSLHVISGIRAIAADVGGGQAFIERVLDPAARAFDNILGARHSGSAHSDRISSLLTYLGWLKGHSDWVPPVLLWWLGRSREPAELAWFLGALDRLAYGLRILGHGNKRRSSRFGAVVHAIRSGRDLRNATSPLNLAREELRTIHHNLRDLHARSAPMAKLVLLRLNDHLAGSPQIAPFDDLSVEHLLPRKPGFNSPWRECFPDPGERDRHTESLGNLVLVTKAQNDKAGNLDFARKKDVLFKAAGAPLLPVNAYVRQQNEWKAQQIRERETELLHHLDQLWNIGPAPSRPPPASNSGMTSSRTRQPQIAGA
ncbi:MAG: DUF262 domain-containing HNH endonuclease family protein [Hyphomonadaceae bacterium]|nr:DUF262 domain-containing HNH endonuclease family protein [Hyphomonadaceae bacterium]